jgi:hypothetical protein
MKTLFTFKSNWFNTTESKKDFVNPNCFGDDVAKWLITELKQKVEKIDLEPSPEDYGWYFNFSTGKDSVRLVIGLRPDDRTWIGWLENKRGFLGSIFLGWKEGVSEIATKIINEILSKSDKVSDLKWHNQRDFDMGKEEFGTTQVHQKLEELFKEKILAVRNYASNQTEFRIDDFKDISKLDSILGEVSTAESDITPAGKAFIQQYYKMDELAKKLFNEGNKHLFHEIGAESSNDIKEWLLAVKPMESVTFIEQARGKIERDEPLREDLLPPND